MNLQELKEALREIESKPDMETLTLKEKSDNQCAANIAFTCGMTMEEVSAKLDVSIQDLTNTSLQLL